MPVLTSIQIKQRSNWQPGLWLNKVTLRDWRENSIPVAVVAGWMSGR